MERLNQCAENGDVEALYSIIAEDPYVLEHFDGIPFVDTPLHVAAAAGNTHFAMEMANLKPSFARKLNRLGLSPIHLALINGHDVLVRSIIKIDSELIRVKAKGMVTPLHYAIQIDNIDLLAEFLSVCPSSIEDLTVKCESVVHLAVKNIKLRALLLLLLCLVQFNKEEILKWKDDDGNTILHIAADTDQREVMELVIPKVNVNAKNLNGLTAMDIYNNRRNSLDSKIGKILIHAGAKKASELDSSSATIKDYSQALSFIKRQRKFLGFFVKSQDKDIRNFVLVVAVLIAAATYQAVLSPPAGYWQENSKSEDSSIVKTNDTDINCQGKQEAGKMILGSISKYSLFYFSITNSLAFCASVVTILLNLVGVPYFTILALATNFLSFAYFSALTTTWPSADGTWYPWATVAFTALLFLSNLLVYVVPFVASYNFRKLKDPMDVITKHQN